MLAAKNETIGRAISGVWQLTEEERIREQCRAREDWIINDRWKTETIAEQAETIAELTQAKEKLLANDKIQKGTIAELTQAKEELLANEKKQADTIAEQEAELAKYREQFGPLKKETE